MIQNQEWLEWRLNGIGGSDAPIVMQVSPWSTPYKLWEQKTRRVGQEEANFAMRRGLILEDKARHVFQTMYGKEFKPTTVEHEKHSFIRASLDGLNDRIGLEIKCPNKDDHAMAVAGKIPEKYIYQLAHQCLAANLEKVEYFSFNGESGTTVTYNRNEKTEKELFKEESKFWEMVKTDTAPELTNKDYRVITNNELVEACEQFKTNRELIKKLEAEQEAFKKMLSEQAQGKPIICSGVAVQTITRKGNVVYKNIPQLNGVDLEQFRGKPTIYVNVSVRGEK